MLLFIVLLFSKQKKQKTMDTTFVQYALLGTPEIIVIVVVIVLLFGGRKIPELMRGIGKGIKEFKEGINDDDNNPKTNDNTSKPSDDKAKESK